MATTNLGRVKPIHRGVYDPDFPYTPLDIVRYQGASYFCIKASQGNVPQDGEFFMAIVDGDLRYAQTTGGADANFIEAPQIDGQSLDDRYQQQEAGKGLTANDYTDNEKAKLEGIESEATKNATDAQLRDRSTHTGTQTLDTISDAGSAAAKDTGTADAELPTVQQIRDTFEIFVPDPERRAVEAATSGAATIERTPRGQSCYMWIVNKGRAEDLEPGGALGSGIHEAFLVNAAEKDFYMLGMYPAAQKNGEVVSQPGLAPWVSNTFDETLSACSALGAGWHQLTVWEWAYIALWCMANGYQPTGNTNHGRSHANVWETAARQDGGVPGDSSGVGNTLTGYGPNAWNHNAGANGIADLVGNVWERLNLMKMVDARVFLANDNDFSLAETSWADTGFDLPSNRTWSTIDNTGASDKLKRALVVPNGVLDPEGHLYTTLTGERIPLRGGSRPDGGNAGLGALHLNGARSSARSNIGLRLARVI